MKVLFVTFVRLLPVLAVAPVFAKPATQIDPNTHTAAASKTGPLDGVWLAQSAMRGNNGLLNWVWLSRFSVSGNSFDISNVYDPSKGLHLRGTFLFPAKDGPQAIDLNIDELDMSAAVKYPRCRLRGIYQLDGERLAICFHTAQDAGRPTELQPLKDGILLRLVRANPDFKDFPHDVTVAVKDPQGNPAAGISVFNFMSFWVPGAPKPNEPPPAWKYREIAKTRADGRARVAYQELNCAMARDPAHRLIGIAEVSPASVLAKSITIQLHPQCVLRGTIACDALKQANKPIGWTNVGVNQNGQSLGQCSSRQGEFEFALAPGSYTLWVYGSNVLHQYVHVDVPPGREALELPPISAEALGLPLIEGKAAPELRGVVAWKGTPIKLAGQRGKLVLLDFWGYWCGPCVAEMPALIQLHERYHDRGLVIVGVHVDMHGEVDSAAKLDEKTASIKKELWGGKELPFPIALMSGKQLGAGNPVEGALADYGIDEYPTTILIDREGKVVGTFEPRDPDTSAEIERLLAAGK